MRFASMMVAGLVTLGTSAMARDYTLISSDRTGTTLVSMSTSISDMTMVSGLLERLEDSIDELQKAVRVQSQQMNTHRTENLAVRSFDKLDGRIEGLRNKIEENGVRSEEARKAMNDLIEAHHAASWTLSWLREPELVRDEFNTMHSLMDNLVSFYTGSNTMSKFDDATAELILEEDDNIDWDDEFSPFEHKEMDQERGDGTMVYTNE